MNNRIVLNEIEIANSWRFVELLNIKQIYQKLNNDDKKTNDFQQYIVKSAIPMIYAQWEGYVVTSLEILFNALNQEKLKIQNIHENLLTCSYEQNLKSISESTNFEKYNKHLKIILNMFQNEIKFNKKIDTKSNLNYSMLEEICCKLRFNILTFSDNKSILNQLVYIRNALSHGENNYQFKKIEDIEKYFDLYTNLSEKFILEIDSFLNEKKYLK